MSAEDVGEPGRGTLCNSCNTHRSHQPGSPAWGMLLAGLGQGMRERTCASSAKASSIAADRASPAPASAAGSAALASSAWVRALWNLVSFDIVKRTLICRLSNLSRTCCSYINASVDCLGASPHVDKSGQGQTPESCVFTKHIPLDLDPVIKFLLKDSPITDDADMTQQWA